MTGNRPNAFIAPMPRPFRIQFAGAIYHLMSRGDRREPIFRDDTDRRGFLATLGEACEKTGWQVHAYCWMNNHFHLVAETPQPNLVVGMKWLLGTYTGRFNRAASIRRASLERALQVHCGGRTGRRVSAHRVRLCAFESGAGRAGGNPAAVVGLP
ncbi:MAG: transposase, partial [Verrucomicrobia bacterium]|nr:transposase [Verrucomicrobiota bacterium]